MSESFAELLKEKSNYPRHAAGFHHQPVSKIVTCDSDWSPSMLA